MKLAVAISIAGLAVITGPAWSQDRPPSDKATLTICLPSDDPPLSRRGQGPGATPSGFDVVLSQTIARHLGRSLRMQWFNSRDGRDASLVKDASALLSNGRCQLLAEYPLLSSTMRDPSPHGAKPPPFDAATEDDRRLVKGNPLAATRPYRTDALTVVLSAHDADRPVRTLGDLDGLKIGVQTATLSDAIAVHYGHGRLAAHVVHLPDARAVLRALQTGKIGAAFIDLRAFDAWVGQHASSGLAPSGYTHSLAFNMGFIGLASDMALIHEVDSVLAELQAKDAIVPMATSTGLTYLPPRMPAIGADVTPSALQGD